MPSAISIEHISMHFGDPAQPVKALDNVSLEIRANEFFTLLGPSGCGKTTLLRLIAGFEQPSSGTIRLYGEPMQDLPPFRRPVNTVFQSYALFPHMTVAENIGFGLEMRGTGRSEIEQTQKAGRGRHRISRRRHPQRDGPASLPQRSKRRACRTDHAHVTTAKGRLARRATQCIEAP